MNENHCFIDSLRNLGGGTLGIAGWGCAGTLNLYQSYNLGQNKMEQQTPIPPPNQG